MVADKLSDPEKFQLIYFIRDRPNIWNTDSQLMRSSKVEEFNEVADKMKKVFHKDYQGIRHPEACMARTSDLLLKWLDEEEASDEGGTMAAASSQQNDSDEVPLKRRLRTRTGMSQMTLLSLSTLEHGIKASKQLLESEQKKQKNQEEQNQMEVTTEASGNETVPTDDTGEDSQQNESEPASDEISVGEKDDFEGEMMDDGLFSSGDQQDDDESVLLGKMVATTHRMLKANHLFREAVQFESRIGKQLIKFKRKTANKEAMDSKAADEWMNQ